MSSCSSEGVESCIVQCCAVSDQINFESNGVDADLAGHLISVSFGFS